jgi:hypothetical protein
MSCAICEARKPRRYCPGVRGDICAICCGTEREVTVDCPLDCVYLQDARKHERPQSIEEKEIPDRDITVSEGFLERNNALVSFLGSRLARAVYEIPGLIDFDIREGVAALVRTFRTQQSGIYYETRPQSPVAGNLYLLLQAALAEFRQAEQQQLGISRTRDADVLGVLTFFARLEVLNNNRRARGKAFIDFLRAQFPGPEQKAPPPASSLIIP